MFQSACKKVRESTYAVLCKTPISENQFNLGNGSAFMIAPGICLTASHVLHVNGDKSQPLHKIIEVIRSPDIGGRMVTASFIAEDITKDIALIKIDNPTNTSSLKLFNAVAKSGTSSGSFGYPLATVGAGENSIRFNITERFQGSYISTFQRQTHPTTSFTYYEIDGFIYEGASGCACFNVNGNVLGMIVGSVDMNKNNVVSRLSISIAVSSLELIQFCKENGVNISTV